MSDSAGRTLPRVQCIISSGFRVPLGWGRGRYGVASPAGIELSEPPLIQEYHPVGDKTSFIVL